MHLPEPALPVPNLSESESKFFGKLFERFRQ